MASTRRSLQALRPCICRPASRLQIRSLSSAPAAAPLPSVAQSATYPPASTVALLTDLRDLLARYPLLHDSEWSTRLDNALADLKHPRRARIAVIGNKQSGASELVTAAFDDPLSSDGDMSLALASRRLGEAAEALHISYGTSTRRSPHELALPAPWLRDHQTDIVEIVHSDFQPQQSSVSALYASDAVILLLSSTRGLSTTSVRSLLSEIASKPNLLLAVNSAEPLALSSSIAKATRVELDLLLPEGAQPELQVISITQAMEALEALSPTEPGHEISYEKFSTGYVSSGIPQLKDRLVDLVAPITQPSTEIGPASALQLQTARHTLSKAVAVAAFEGAKIADSLHQASADISALSFETSEATAATLSSLGVEDGLLRIPPEDIAASSNALRHLLDTRFAWYTLPWRIDDLSSEIALVASTTYLPHFESHLLVSTGRLISLTQALSSKTDTFLHSSPSFSPSSRAAAPLSSLYSPTLLNRIDQASVESASLPSTALASPLTYRRAQLSSPGGPAEVLQRRAQSALASAMSLTGGSVVLGAGMQLLQWAELATNVGVGLLGTTAAAWGLQRAWGKARDRFYVDVEKRVTGGLEEDLGIAARRLVDRSAYKARTAVALCEELLSKKRGDFELFKTRLSKIDQGRREL